MNKPFFDLVLDEFSNLKDSYLNFPEENDFSIEDDQTIELTYDYYYSERYHEIVKSMVDLYNLCIKNKQSTRFNEIIQEARKLFHTNNKDVSHYNHIYVNGNIIKLRADFWYRIEVEFEYNETENAFYVTSYGYWSQNGRGSRAEYNHIHIGPFDNEQVLEICKQVINDNHHWFPKKYKLE